MLPACTSLNTASGMNGNAFTVMNLLLQKKINAAPVFCKMQTQCPKNNSYLAAVIIIGNTSENSSPSCV